MKPLLHLNPKTKRTKTLNLKNAEEEKQHDSSESPHNKTRITNSSNNILFRSMIGDFDLVTPLTLISYVGRERIRTR